MPNTVIETKANHNLDQQIEGIVINQYQKQANLPRQLVEELIEAGHPVLESKISPSVKIRKSHSQSSPVVHFAPNHKLTEEFQALYAEIHS